MRTGGRPTAGSFSYSGDELVTTWHRHDLHQIEFALRGVVEVETAAAHYLLPPQQAAWIPAGAEHRTTIRSAVRTISVFFAPELVPVPGERVRILAVPAVLREMMVYSSRWPIGREGSDALADAFFVALGRLVSDSLDDEAPLSLPVSTEPVVAAAMEWTRRHLGTATVGDVARCRRRVATLAAPAVRGLGRDDLARVPAAGPAPSGHGPVGGARAVGPRGGGGGRFRQPECLQPSLPEADR